MQHLSKSAALRATRGAVSIVRCDRTSYLIMGPWSIDDMSGPSTQQQADSWPKARKIAAAWRAECAACLMGIEAEISVPAIQWAAYSEGIDDVGSLIDAAVEAGARRAQR